MSENIVKVDEKEYESRCSYNLDIGKGVKKNDKIEIPAHSVLMYIDDNGKNDYQFNEKDEPVIVTPAECFKNVKFGLFSKYTKDLMIIRIFDSLHIEKSTFTMAIDDPNDKSNYYSFHFVAEIDAKNIDYASKFINFVKTKEYLDVGSIEKAFSAHCSYKNKLYSAILQIMKNYSKEEHHYNINLEKEPDFYLREVYKMILDEFDKWIFEQGLYIEESFGKYKSCVKFFDK